MSDTPALQFPTEFPIKVMGRDSADFQSAVRDIVGRHAGGSEGLHITTRPSAGGNFIALTVTIEAVSQAQLDAIYTELSAHPLVLMAL